MICKKNGVKCSWDCGDVIFPLTVGLGQSPGWGPEKLDFFCSKGRRLAYYGLLFSAVCLSRYRWYMRAVQVLACIEGFQMWTGRPIWNNATGTLTLKRASNAKPLPWSESPAKICASLQTLRQPEQGRSPTIERNVSLLFRRTIAYYT